MARLGCPFKVVPVQFIKLSCHKSICLNHEQRNTRRLLVEYRLAVKAWLVCLSTPMCLTEWCPEFALYHIVHTKVFNKERWVTDRKGVKIVFLRVLQLKDSSDRHVLFTYKRVFNYLQLQQGYQWGREAVMNPTPFAWLTSLHSSFVGAGDGGGGVEAWSTGMEEAGNASPSSSSSSSSRWVDGESLSVEQREAVEESVESVYEEWVRAVGSESFVPQSVNKRGHITK